MKFKIGHVARVAKLTVRALHHYDEIGLVKPSGRSETGYRLYTQRDLERLQDVLFYRELGFALEEIQRVLADPTFDRKSALIRQRAELAEKAAQANALLNLIDKTIESMDRGEAMQPQYMFDGFDPSKYEDETKARWGSADSYAESVRRTKRYTKEDWQSIRSEFEAITIAFADIMKAGIAPTDQRAMDIAERHRLHIDRWFYPCPTTMHMELGEMYVSDDRFAANYEKHRKGLTEYIRDAIAANSNR
jgi:DNA-binding transcriptional MerR regulator